MFMINTDKMMSVLERLGGMYDVIGQNDMNQLFYEKLDEKGIDIDNVTDAFNYISDYISQDYQDNKEQADNAYVSEVVEHMENILKYAEAIKGYQEMGEINLQLAEEGLYAENEVDSTNSEGKTE
jgi:hypothetical protein